MNAAPLPSRPSSQCGRAGTATSPCSGASLRDAPTYARNGVPSYGASLRLLLFRRFRNIRRARARRTRADGGGHPRRALAIADQEQLAAFALFELHAKMQVVLVQELANLF